MCNNYVMSYLLALNRMENHLIELNQVRGRYPGNKRRNLIKPISKLAVGILNNFERIPLEKKEDEKLTNLIYKIEDKIHELDNKKEDLTPEEEVELERLYDEQQQLNNQQDEIDFKDPVIFNNLECSLVLARTKAIAVDIIVYEPIEKGFTSRNHAYKQYQFFPLEKTDPFDYGWLPKDQWETDSFDPKVSFNENESFFEITYTIPEDLLLEGMKVQEKKFKIEKVTDSYPENMNFYSALQASLQKKSF